MDLSKLSIKIPPEALIALQLGLTKIPEVQRVGKKLIRLRDTIRATIADGDVDFEDVLTWYAAYQSAPGVVPPLPPGVVVVPEPIEDPDPSALEMPDAVSLKLNWAAEPGLDDEGQQALIPVEVELDRNTRPYATIVFPTHPQVVNDRTKITLEAGLSLNGKGLHFSDHPYLANRITWVARTLDLTIVGTLGPGGRVDNGVGWGGTRYEQSGGTLGVASIKPTLKGKMVLFHAEVGGNIASEVFQTRVVV